MKISSSILILLILMASIAFAKDDITKELITSNGKTRAYYLYVPSTVKADAPVPLVVMLHGSGHVAMSLVSPNLCEIIRWRKRRQNQPSRA